MRSKVWIRIVNSNNPAKKKNLLAASQEITTEDDVKYLAAPLNKLTNNILLAQIRPLANKLINNTEKIDKIKILIEEQKHD